VHSEGVVRDGLDPKVLDSTYRFDDSPRVLGGGALHRVVAEAPILLDVDEVDGPDNTPLLADRGGDLGDPAGFVRVFDSKGDRVLRADVQLGRFDRTIPHVINPHCSSTGDKPGNGRATSGPAPREETHTCGEVPQAGGWQ
jgi:hypothetical protein